MYGVVLLLVVAMLSLLLTRIATIALTATGMSQPSARFQARSALTGVGFTTTESEAVVAHPARRMARNSVKVYDKVSVLRVETTIS